MSQSHLCPICNGNRPHNGLICLGCGTSLIVCAGKKPKQVQRHECPSCAANGPHKLLEPGRFCCKKCLAVFESADGYAVDDRPDRNAEKLEELRNRKRGGYRHK